MINILKNKFSKNLIFINICYTIVYFFLILVFRNQIIWGINDDFVLDQIINNKSNLSNSVVSFFSLFLGFILSIITKIINYPHVYGWFLIISNWLTILILLNLFLNYKIKLNKILSIFILSLIIPYIILNPTYTITSILLSFAGVLLILYGVLNKYINSKFFLISGIILSLGISIRLDSYKGIIVFLGIYFIIFFTIQIKNIKIKYIFFAILPTIVTIILQFLLTAFISNSSTNTREYLDFQNIRHELFYTPAILKLHQNVIADKVLPEIWGDVEFTLFRNWFYPDQHIFNSANLQIGKESVKEYMGVIGFIKSDQIENIKTILYYLTNVKLILIIIFLVFLLNVIVAKNLKKILLLNFGLIFGYLISFLYAAAVLRLPIRVTFPYLIILGLLFIFNLEITEVKKFAQNKILLKITVIFLISVSFWFNYQKSFGSKLLFTLNKEKYIWANQRDQEIKKFDKNAVFVGPVVHLPAAQTGPFLNANDFSSLNQTLVLDWSTFSPSWKMKSQYLGLNPENIFSSLAKTKDVYLISEPGLASVIDMYMNDHNILRGKLCPVMELTGYDNAKIFTFQAKENSC